MRARRLPLDLAAAGLVGGEGVRDRLARLGLERDVVLVQVDLAVLVAGDVDGDGVALVRLQRVWATSCWRPVTVRLKVTFWPPLCWLA